MTTIVTRAGKGTPLTHIEMDANLTNLNTDKIEIDTTDTLTNKSIDLASNTLTGTTAQFNTALSDGSFATQAGTETLTNKSVNLTNNTLTGTEAEFNTALSDGSFVTKKAGAAGTAEQGYANLPSGTTAQRPAVGAVGDVRWNTSLSIYEGYTGASWEPLGGAAKGGAGNYVFFENDLTVSVDYTITTNKNAITAGPITIGSGITVTVPTGSTWTVA